MFTHAVLLAKDLVLCGWKSTAMNGMGMEDTGIVPLDGGTNSAGTVAYTSCCHMTVQTHGYCKKQRKNDSQALLNVCLLQLELAFAGLCCCCQIHTQWSQSWFMSSTLRHATKSLSKS